MKRLQLWEEVMGIPEKVEQNYIVFKGIGAVEIENKNILQKASKNIGRKIAILRTDIERKEYCWRVVD